MTITALPTTTFKIPETKWNDLSEQDRGILSSLGFKIAKEKPPPRRKEKPFILGVFIYCHLCEKEHSTKWKMKPVVRDGILFWQGSQLKGDTSRVLFRKVEIRNQSTCKHCLGELSKQTPETLAKKLIIYAKEVSSKKEKKL